jgi:hypothetical protein
LAGTEAAEYAGNSETEPVVKKANFRKEHKQFVETLAAAKKFAAYEKAREEGKVVGKPPPLPQFDDEDDGRVQCPTCKHKFGADVAKRHIPVCERIHATKRSRR